MSETVVFEDPDGTVTTLTSDPYAVEWGVTGRFMPPVAFVEDEVPGLPGARLRQAKIQAREVAVPVAVAAADAVTLRDTVRELIRRLYPARGDGILRITAHDGEIRELVCRYNGGFQGVETREEGGLVVQKGVIVFRAAEDPFWRASSPTSLSFATGTPPTFFPFFPMRIGHSTVFGGVTITNPGDVESWPTWTVTGPGSNLVIVNETTGKQLAMDTVLVGGDEIIIDTTPGVKTVTMAGVNLYGDLDDGSELFPFVAGDNDITVELDGATVDSLVEISYRPRYLTP